MTPTMQAVVKMEMRRTVGAPSKGPGVFVFTPAMTLLYGNWEARELCARVNLGRAGKPVKGVIPVEVFDLCQELLERMSTRVDPKDCEQVTAHGTLGDTRHQVQVHAFGIPDPLGTGHSRLLVILQELGGANGGVPGEVRERFRLTEREEQALRYLIKGWTNKEIAQELEISEHTVKAHVKHIMQKTRASTRTEVLAHLHAF